MQAEDIIQQKEWHLLTDAERELLQPLAADEQEFNLLKKMLLLAEEDAAAVPAIDPNIQRRLQDSLQGKNQPSKRRWYYAAAIALAIGVGAAYLIQNRKDEPIAHEIPRLERNQKEITPGTEKNQPLVITPPVQETIVKTPEKKDVIVPKVIPPDTYVQTPVQPPIDTIKTNPPPYASINTMLKNDSALMAFVAEAY
jgi:hypothetical protein